MKNFIVSLLLILAFSSACNEKQQIKNASVVLNEIIETYQEHKGYDDKEFPLGLSTKEFYQKEANYAKELLDLLNEINENNLSDTEKISLTLLKFTLQETIDYNSFEQYLNPLLSDSGFHVSLPYMVRPLNNYDDVKKYLNELNALPVFVDQHLDLLQLALAKGITQPKVIFKGYESTYNTHITDNPVDNFFYSPFKDLPTTLTDSQKDSVIEKAKAAIELIVVPQFKRIKNFFEVEYFPKARTTIGISELPNGKAFYQNRINFYTTSTQYTADDIHRVGLKEVARIKAEMEKIITDLNFIAFQL